MKGAGKKRSLTPGRGTQPRPQRWSGSETGTSSSSRSGWPGQGPTAAQPPSSSPPTQEMGRLMTLARAPPPPLPSPPTSRLLWVQVHHVVLVGGGGGVEHEQGGLPPCPRMNGKKKRWMEGTRLSMSNVQLETIADH